ncbi:hypothetical protein DBR40_23895, partial [Pedobacter sp. KBW01]|uniref:RHS repeat domain-containing protein n=1 Tax=Pedobacter sp. KBW01 TaxID=2153364 RepID=UPI000FA32F81
GNNLGETISYDVMGNITSLTRDNFGTYNYTGYDGNRLTAISGFTNGTYSYDANGNQKTNTARGITNINYNYLNLPVSVTGPNVNYTYTAAGEKLQKQAGGITTNYIDGIQYTNNSIDFIQTEEGLARRNGSSYSYEYNLSDHLGNVRVTFYRNPNTNQLEVLQRDDYYAFGLRKEPVAKAGLNKYLYNGKELQEELGQYDYGARFYDPVIGRWNVVDPMSELDRKTTPYAYAFDDPIRHTDPDGMFGEDVNEDFDDGEDPKPKQTASTGVLTVGGAILRGLATIAEGVEVVGVGASTAIAGVVVGVFLPQDMGSNGWKPSPSKPSSLIIPTIVSTTATFKQIEERINKVNEAKKTASEPNTTARGTAGKLEKSPTGKGTVPPAEREKKRVPTAKEKEAERKANDNNCTNCGNKTKPEDTRSHHYPKRHADGGTKTTPVCKECHTYLHSTKK